jgi:hypothetical protein
MKISFYPVVRREPFGARGVHMPYKMGSQGATQGFPTT